MEAIRAANSARLLKSLEYESLRFKNKDLSWETFSSNCVYYTGMTEEEFARAKWILRARVWYNSKSLRFHHADDGQKKIAFRQAGQEDKLE